VAGRDFVKRSLFLGAFGVFRAHPAARLAAGRGWYSATPTLISEPEPSLFPLAPDHPTMPFILHRRIVSISYPIFQNQLATSGVSPYSTGLRNPTVDGTHASSYWYLYMHKAKGTLLGEVKHTVAPWKPMTGSGRFKPAGYPRKIYGR
jgi:hypothetical protein